jgi:hypothetical protein
MARMPQGSTVNALQATLPGVGRMLFRPPVMVYEPGRNEVVLSAARAKYGDEFVDWVLARERLIVEALSK